MNAVYPSHWTKQLKVVKSKQCIKFHDILLFSVLITSYLFFPWQLAYFSIIPGCQSACFLCYCHALPMLLSCFPCQSNNLKRKGNTTEIAEYNNTVTERRLTIFTGGLFPESIDDYVSYNHFITSIRYFQSILQCVF